MPWPAMSGAEPPDGSYMLMPEPAAAGAGVGVGGRGGVGGLAAVCCAPIEAEGIRPSEPGSTEAASERMSPARRAGGVEERGEGRDVAREASASPNRFSVATTSKWEGRRISCIAALSTYLRPAAAVEAGATGLWARVVRWRSRT